MRPAVFALAVVAAVLAARTASAASLCDPAGHFCLQIDTTSATVCRPLQPGGLNPESCSAADGEMRRSARKMDETTHGAIRAVDGLVLRFDDLAVSVLLIRRAAEPEAGGDAGAREAMTVWTQWFARSRPAGWLVEEVQPPTLQRINTVQVGRLEMRLSSAGIGGAVVLRNVTYEVRARDAAYLVSFDAAEPEAERLSAVAAASMATLDTIPVKSPTNAGDALTWLVRGAVAAVVLVGVGWLVGRRRGRRPAIDSRDLWPR